MNFDIEKLKRKLLIKYPGFATVIANMKFIPSYSCISNGNPTAGTDGSNFIYHPDYIKSISLEEQLFVSAHEVSHIALNHIKRSEGKDPELWNIATDAVINDQLKKDGLIIPKGSVEIEGASKYDAETLYNKLLEEKNKKENQNNSSDNQQNDSNNNFSNEQSNTLQNNSNNNQNTSNNENSSSNSSDNNFNEENNTNSNNNNYSDAGHDTHRMWEEAIKKSKEENSAKESELEKVQKENTELGEKKVFEQNKEQRKENLKKLREALASQSLGYGTGTNSNYIKIEDIGNGSLINWQTILKNTVNSKIDWSYKNATIEDGVVTPHLEDLSHPETEILLDTSGSVSSELLRNFLRECKGILNTSHIKVGCFDTRFYGFTEIKRESDIDNMQFQGGGGTNFNSAVNAFTKRVDNKIIFTDGLAPMPDMVIDAIWIVYGDEKINPKGGKVIYISEEQLDRLCLLTENKGKTL